MFLSATKGINYCKLCVPIVAALPLHTRVEAACCSTHSTAAVAITFTATGQGSAADAMARLGPIQGMRRAEIRSELTRYQLHCLNFAKA
jgi:hypothetical protein